MAKTTKDIEIVLLIGAVMTVAGFFIGARNLWALGFIFILAGLGARLLKAKGR